MHFLSWLACWATCGAAGWVAAGEESKLSLVNVTLLQKFGHFLFKHSPVHVAFLGALLLLEVAKTILGGREPYPHPYRFFSRSCFLVAASRVSPPRTEDRQEIGGQGRTPTPNFVYESSSSFCEFMINCRAFLCVEGDATIDECCCC